MRISVLFLIYFPSRLAYIPTETCLPVNKVSEINISYVQHAYNRVLNGKRRLLNVLVEIVWLWPEPGEEVAEGRGRMLLWRRMLHRMLLSPVWAAMLSPSTTSVFKPQLFRAPRY